MPAKTQKQQRFFGYLESHPLEAAARGFKPKLVHEFAQAPGGTIKGLPKQAGARGLDKGPRRLPPDDQTTHYYAGARMPMMMVIRSVAKGHVGRGVGKNVGKGIGRGVGRQFGARGDE